MKKVILVVLLISIFLASGCIENFGFGPEGAVNSFYSSLNAGNYKDAAVKTTIPIDKDFIFGDDAKTSAFVLVAETLFGKNGERLSIGSVTTESKEELDISKYNSVYKGNLTAAYKLNVKIPLTAAGSTSIFGIPLNATIEGYKYTTHEVFKVGGKYYVKVDLNNLKDIIVS